MAAMLLPYQRPTYRSIEVRTDHLLLRLEHTLTDQPWKIMSIARRDWAAVGAKTIR